MRVIFDRHSGASDEQVRKGIEKATANFEQELREWTAFRAEPAAFAVSGLLGFVGGTFLGLLRERPIASAGWMVLFGWVVLFVMAGAVSQFVMVHSRGEYWQYFRRAEVKPSLIWSHESCLATAVLTE